jgi:hypothetical protein
MVFVIFAPRKQVATGSFAAAGAGGIVEILSFAHVASP